MDGWMQVLHDCGSGRAAKGSQSLPVNNFALLLSTCNPKPFKTDDSILALQIDNPTHSSHITPQTASHNPSPHNKDTHTHTHHARETP